MNIRDLIRDSRLKNNLTMVELADKIGSTQSAISAWESGKSEPAPKYQRKLQEVLGIEFNDIASEPVASYDIQRMVGTPKLSILDNMSEAQKNMAEAQINMTEAQLNMTKSNVELIEIHKELIQQNTVLTKKILEMMELNKG